jgi:hypothetical protein
MDISTTDDRGVVEVLDADAYLREHPDADIATCGACMRSWDDAVSTSWTPAPSGRCPFEYEHELPMPDSFTLMIELGNAAMQLPEDVGALLIELGEKLQAHAGTVWEDISLPALRDANGNTVGRWEVS